MPLTYFLREANCRESVVSGVPVTQCNKFGFTLGISKHSLAALTAKECFELMLILGFYEQKQKTEHLYNAFPCLHRQAYRDTPGIKPTVSHFAT